MTYSVHPPLIAYFKFLLPLISSTVKYLKSGKFDLFKWIGINFNGYMLLKQLFFIQTNGHFLLDFFIFGFSKKRKLYDFFIRRNSGYVNVHYKSIVYIRAFKVIACWHHVLQVWFPHLALQQNSLLYSKLHLPRLFVHNNNCGGKEQHLGSQSGSHRQ